jgi:hypothetical protein
MSDHTDPHIIDEIAYNCFWFEQATLLEELIRLEIRPTVENLEELLLKVEDKRDMWSDFYDALDSLIQDVEE